MTILLSEGRVQRPPDKAAEESDSGMSHRRRRMKSVTAEGHTVPPRPVTKAPGSGIRWAGGTAMRIRAIR